MSQVAAWAQTQTSVDAQLFINGDGEDDRNKETGHQAETSKWERDNMVRLSIWNSMIPLGMRNGDRFKHTVLVMYRCD